MPNDLETYFRANDRRFVTKWSNYFEVYESHFSRFRNREIVIVEIGVMQGGSLQMWRHYFGDRAKIFGIDIDPRCKVFEGDNVRIFTGSQEDREFLREVKRQIGPIDILIDDGGHSMRQQIVTFEELFDAVKDDGVYLCEDVHTSYWLKFGGGHRRRGTYLEYTKNLIDQLNAFHSDQRSLRVDSFTRTADSIHFYDSMVVIEKRRRTKPEFLKTGHYTFEYAEENVPLGGRIRNRFLFLTNRLLRFFRLGGFIWR